MDNQYMVFLDNRQFDQGSLDAHLEYLKMYDGTPDMLESFSDLEDAINEAKVQSENNECKAVVYSWYEERIITKFFKYEEIK